MSQVPAPGGERPLGYFVFSWVDASMAQELVDWLCNGHVAEVLEQPGMLRAEVIVLDERSPEGRIGVVCAYQLRSQQDYDAYLSSSAKARFNVEGRRFASSVTSTRWHGHCVLALQAGVARSSGAAQ